jgi:hypothetical protein
MKAYDGNMAPPFMTSALRGGELSPSQPRGFIPNSYWIGGWVGFRAGLHAMGKRKISCHIWESNPSPACNLVTIQTIWLYCLNGNLNISVLGWHFSVLHRAPQLYSVLVVRRLITHTVGSLKVLFNTDTI